MLAEPDRIGVMAAPVRAVMPFLEAPTSWNTPNVKPILHKPQDGLSSFLSLWRPVIQKVRCHFFGKISPYPITHKTTKRPTRSVLWGDVMTSFLSLRDRYGWRLRLKTTKRPHLHQCLTRPSFASLICPGKHCRSRGPPHYWDIRPNNAVIPTRTPTRTFWRSTLYTTIKYDTVLLML